MHKGLLCFILMASARWSIFCIVRKKVEFNVCSPLFFLSGLETVLTKMTLPKVYYSLKHVEMSLQRFDYSWTSFKYGKIPLKWLVPFSSMTKLPSMVFISSDKFLKSNRFQVFCHFSGLSSRPEWKFGFWWSSESTASSVPPMTFSVQQILACDWIGSQVAARNW